METRTVAELKTNPLNPRGEVIEDDALRELAESIRSHGVLQPILITPDGTVVTGHRRAKACEIIGVREIPVVVQELDESAQLQIMLIENLQRADLNPVQEGKAFASLIEMGLTRNQINKATGIGQERIKTRLEIACLPEECHQAFATGKLRPSCVHCLSGMSPKRQIMWVTHAFKMGWPGTKLCSEIHERSAATRASPAPNASGSPGDTREKVVSTAIRKLYDITDRLEEYKDLRPALKIFADGIFMLEQSLPKSRRNVSIDQIESSNRSSLLN